MPELPAEWWNDLPEFRISEQTRMVLRRLLERDGITFYGSATRQAVKRGYVKRSVTGYCTLTETGKAVCRQLGMTARERGK